MRKIELEDQSKLGPYQATEAELAAIEEGLRSLDEHGGTPIDEVFDRIRKEHRSWVKNRKKAKALSSLITPSGG